MCRFEEANEVSTLIASPTICWQHRRTSTNRVWKLSTTDGDGRSRIDRWLASCRHLIFMSSSNGRIETSFASARNFCV